MRSRFCLCFLSASIAGRRRQLCTKSICPICTAACEHATMAGLHRAPVDHRRRGQYRCSNGCASALRKDGRVVECAGLEIRFTGLPVTRVRIPLFPPMVCWQIAFLMKAHRCVCRCGLFFGQARMHSRGSFRGSWLLIPGQIREARFPFHSFLDPFLSVCAAHRLGAVDAAVLAFNCCLMQLLPDAAG